MQEVDDVQRQRTKGMEEISEVGDEASHLSFVSVEVVLCLIDLGDVVLSGSCLCLLFFSNCYGSAGLVL